MKMAPPSHFLSWGNAVPPGPLLGSVLGGVAPLSPPAMFHRRRGYGEGACGAGGPRARWHLTDPDPLLSHYTVTALIAGLQ